MNITVVSEDDLALLKSSLRIDSDSDDKLLANLVVAARKNIIGRIGNEIATFYDDNHEEFSLATILLASHYYNNRSAVSDSEKYTVPLAFDDLIMSLKASYLLALSEVNDYGQED